MNKKPVAALGAVAVLLLAGCGKSSSSASAPTGPQEVDLTANDLMQYNITTIQASPGEQLTVQLTNIGNSPPSVMEHNWVLLKLGANAEQFDQAAADPNNKADGYIPQNLKDEIVAMIPLQPAHHTGQVTFTVPSQPGDYPYMCTFPAHYQAGMHGVLQVK